VHLWSVELPDKVTELGNNVFDGCSSLKSAALPPEERGAPYSSD